MSEPLSSGSEERALDVRARRILFRCWHRGTQECDLVLGSFAEMFLAEFDRTELGQLEALLDCTDSDLFDWIFGQSAPPPEYDHGVMRALRSFCAGGLRRPPISLQHWG